MLKRNICITYDRYIYKIKKESRRKYGSRDFEWIKFPYASVEIMFLFYFSSFSHFSHIWCTLWLFVLLRRNAPLRIFIFWFVKNVEYEAELSLATLKLLESAVTLSELWFVITFYKYYIFSDHIIFDISLFTSHVYQKTTRRL